MNKLLIKENKKNYLKKKNGENAAMKSTKIYVFKLCSYPTSFIRNSFQVHCTPSLSRHIKVLMSIRTKIRTV